MATTFTLFDLIWKCVVELGTARTGVATGGSSTTLIDTDGLRNVDEDYYEDGTIFILKDQAGAGAAPEKEFGEIKAFSAESDQITLFDALGGDVAAGDTYGVSNRRFPLYLLRQKINNELYMGGYIPVEDTSLTTADTLEYTLPDEVSARDLRQILVATSATDGEKYHVPVINWEIQYAATGSISKLRLQKPLKAGMELLLRYATPHPELRAASDSLNIKIHPDRVVYQVCADSLRWYRNKTRLKHLDDTIDLLERKAQLAKDRHPIPPLPMRQSRVTRITRTLRMGGT